jgi:hypothetical protein
MLVCGMTSLQMTVMRTKLSAQLCPVSSEKGILTLLLSSLFMVLIPIKLMKFVPLKSVTSN